MDYSELQLIDGINRCSDKIRDNVSQIIDYTKTETLLNLQALGNISNKIMTIDIPCFLKVSENTQNLLCKTE